MHIYIVHFNNTRKQAKGVFWTLMVYSFRDNIQNKWFNWVKRIEEQKNVWVALCFTTFTNRTN